MCIYCACRVYTLFTLSPHPGRRGGGFYVEVSYKDGTRFSRPVRKYWGGIRYFDLYGYVALAYDVGREVLQLSAYGDYYRASE